GATERGEGWRATLLLPRGRGRGGSLADQFGDGLPGAVVVDQGLAGAGGGDERGDGGVVEGAGEPQAGLVQPRDRVVGEEGVGPADQGQVVAQVLGGLPEVHRRELVADGDALVQGREDPHPQLPGQGRLTDQGQSAGAAR